MTELALTVNRRSRDNCKAWCPLTHRNELSLSNIQPILNTCIWLQVYLLVKQVNPLTNHMCVVLVLLLDNVTVI